MLPFHVRPAGCSESIRDPLQTHRHTVAVIPARYASTRFPGKALVDIADARGATPWEVALAWVLDLSPAVVAIPGHIPVVTDEQCCVLAAPEGIARVHEEHPDVHIVCAAIDRTLNEKGFIVPGLGDAGDRLYGTK